MPRQARLKSKSGIYHIMLRGINQQVIFEDDEDFEKFKEKLETYKAISEYKIFAYCLMPNHVHLLIKIEKEDLDLIIKRIAGSYVYWYNWKYYRKGHLFQDRFKSEPVEDEQYLLTVIRYIHQNPYKAKMVQNIDEYKYSSYNEYKNASDGITDIDFVMSLMDKEAFIKYNNEKNSDECLDNEEKEFRLSDPDAKKVIYQVSKCRNIMDFQELETQQRNEYVKELKRKGLSIRQISRLTGVSFAIVRRM